MTLKTTTWHPPAPRCIQQKAFLPPLDPTFPCWNIREGQLEKTMAYIEALQYWAEKANLPMPGQPCLLARCILELREVMESYMSFSDDTSLDGATSLEGSLEDVTGVAIPRGPSPTSAGTPTEEEATEEAAPTKKPLEGPTHLPVTVNDCRGTDHSPGTTQRTEENGGSPWWLPQLDKSVTPSLAGYHCRTNSPALSGLKGRHHSQSAGGRTAWHQRAEECLQTTKLHPMLPPKSPKLAWEMAPPPGFMGVEACLQRDPSPMATVEAPLEPMQLEILADPAIPTMCTSHIIQDEIMVVPAWHHTLLDPP